MPAKPGRPSKTHTQDAFEQIVLAASACFAEHGVKGSTYKLIASEAGVTAAMVHYYFKTKEQLYLAIILSSFEPLMEKLKQANDLTSWVHIFHQHILGRPWFPHLMLREILPHNGQLRALFLEHCAPHVFGSIKTMVKAEINAAQPSRKLDLDRHVVLLMGMLVYPFLGMEIVQDVTGKKIDKTMLTRFRDDALTLFKTSLAAQ